MKGKSLEEIVLKMEEVAANVLKFMASNRLVANQVTFHELKKHESKYPSKSRKNNHLSRKIMMIIKFN